MSGSETVERVADTRCWTGEGPVWHPDERALYWVDIPRGRLFRYDPATGENALAYERDGAVGGVTVQADGGLLLFCEAGRVVAWTRDGGVEGTVLRVEGEADSRFNDVVADPRGRVFAGTMPTGDRGGRLYRIDADGSVARVRDGVGIPNGMAFAPDRAAMYFAETEADVVHRFPYDEDAGGLGAPEAFVRTDDVEGSPDGLTVDAAGRVWVAFWDGGRIARYAPDGAEERRVAFPARKVSSVGWGGPDYRDAYVTTALGPGEGEPGTRDEEGAGAGALFRADLGVRGVAPYRSRIRT